MWLIERIISFCAHESGWWLAAAAAAIGVIGCRYPTSGAVTILVALSLACFCLPIAFRSTVILNYATFRRLLFKTCYGVIPAVIAMSFMGHHQVANFALVAYLILSVGMLFWAASDPMFAMISWLTFPTEYGRPPDEIRLFDSRMIAWPNWEFQARAYLFQYRYGDKWDYGITGPLTFAFGDGSLEGKTPEEIYSAYAEWERKLPRDLGGHDERRSELL